MRPGSHGAVPAPRWVAGAVGSRRGVKRSALRAGGEAPAATPGAQATCLRRLPRRKRTAHSGRSGRCPGAVRRPRLRLGLSSARGPPPSHPERACRPPRARRPSAPGRRAPPRSRLPGRPGPPGAGQAEVRPAGPPCPEPPPHAPAPRPPPGAALTPNRARRAAAGWERRALQVSAGSAAAPAVPRAGASPRGSFLSGTSLPLSLLSEAGRSAAPGGQSAASRPLLSPRSQFRALSIPSSSQPPAPLPAATCFPGWCGAAGIVFPATPPPLLRHSLFPFLRCVSGFPGSWGSWGPWAGEAGAGVEFSLSAPERALSARVRGWEEAGPRSGCSRPGVG